MIHEERVWDNILSTPFYPVATSNGLNGEPIKLRSLAIFDAKKGYKISFNPKSKVKLDTKLKQEKYHLVTILSQGAS